MAMVMRLCEAQKAGSSGERQSGTHWILGEYLDQQTLQSKTPGGEPVGTPMGAVL